MVLALPIASTSVSLPVWNTHYTPSLTDFKRCLARKSGDTRRRYREYLPTARSHTDAQGPTFASKEEIWPGERSGIIQYWFSLQNQGKPVQWPQFSWYSGSQTWLLCNHLWWINGLAHFLRVKELNLQLISIVYLNWTWLQAARRNTGLFVYVQLCQD